MYLIHLKARLHCLSPGAKVTSTDLPELLGNLQYNVMRNTKDRCKYIPLVSFYIVRLIKYEIYSNILKIPAIWQYMLHCLFVFVVFLNVYLGHGPNV